MHRNKQTFGSIRFALVLQNSEQLHVAGSTYSQCLPWLCAPSLASHALRDSCASALQPASHTPPASAKPLEACASRHQSCERTCRVFAFCISCCLEPPFASSSCIAFLMSSASFFSNSESPALNRESQNEQRKAIEPSFLRRSVSSCCRFASSSLRAF